MPRAAQEMCIRAVAATCERAPGVLDALPPACAPHVLSLLGTSVPLELAVPVRSPPRPLSLVCLQARRPARLPACPTPAAPLPRSCCPVRAIGGGARAHAGAWRSRCALPPPAAAHGLLACADRRCRAHALRRRRAAPGSACTWSAASRRSWKRAQPSAARACLPACAPGRLPQDETRPACPWTACCPCQAGWLLRAAACAAPDSQRIAELA